MPKQHYFFKLMPPRPTFIQDMTDEERRLMEEHGRYFQEHFDAGRLLLFGPVMASGGAFGLGILEVDSERLLTFGKHGILTASKYLSRRCGDAKHLADRMSSAAREARQIGEGDPSVRAGMNTLEIHPMRVSAARAKALSSRPSVSKCVFPREIGLHF